MKRFFLSLITLLAFGLLSYAQGAVEWSAKVADDNTDHPSLVVTATIKGDYHMFSQDNDPAGSNPLEFHFFDMKGVNTVGKFTPNKKYVSEFDDIFGVEQHFYKPGTVTFTQKLKPTAKKWSLTLEIKGQACNDSGCVQLFKEFRFTGTSEEKGEAPEEHKEETESLVPEEETKADSIAQMMDALQGTEILLPKANTSDVHANNYWDNVEAEFKVFKDDPGQQERSLWWIFIAGFIGGLIALVTPCVWPMIPMTVSFFLKQNKTKRESIIKAATYGASIIVIYVALGLAVTAIFGASALNELSTSAVFNIIFFLLLVVFAISFMGGFELTLPASWTNKMDSKVDSTTGLLSIFFMAFTLSLVSFSCTGPIIGTLLVEAASTSNFISPAVGMFGFALALAIPFTLFAMFPTMMKAMPKSGGWMNTVKVVLGFLELALALKFLSVADLAYGWRILDREVFISLWIVIFFLLGVYLLGKLRFPHDDKVEKTGITRFMLACISFAFAVYMLPGLWGAPLKSISAFSPPLYTQDFNLFEGEVSAKVDDYEEGLELSRELGKPVLLDFSGYGCVNCRKMEAAVWTDPEIKSIIDNDYVLVTLMVDDKKPLPEPRVVTETNGESRTLRTYGDLWSFLQRSKFGSQSQPYHVLIDSEGHPLASPFEYREDIPAYLKFLEKGLDNYNKEISERK